MSTTTITNNNSVIVNPNEQQQLASPSSSSSSSVSTTTTTNEFNIPESVLSDLCSRFIINLPDEDRNDLIRVFFQIEIAHWFYLDFYCDDSTYSSSSSSGSSGGSSGSSSSSGSSTSQSSSSSSSSSSDSDTDDACNLISRKHPLLKPCSIRQFAALIFRYCPFLMQHSHNVDDILSNWRLFKHAVPTNGAIILDAAHKNVLLVQGFWAKASWGFPKGKVNENESEAACARREVLEETGFDIEQAGMRDDQYLQIQMQEQTIRLYIVDGVSMKTKFEPRTRKEIKEVRWFPIDDLPVHRKDHRTKHRLGFSPNSFFMVIPFVKSLKQWVAIQNGSLPSAQLINGCIVHAKTPINHLNHSSMHKHSSSSNNKKNSRHSNNNNNQQSMSAGKSTVAPPGVTPVSGSHRRRNSHSHSGGGGNNQGNYMNSGGNNHHHHHHHHHNSNYNHHNSSGHNHYSLNHYQQQTYESPNQVSIRGNTNNNTNKSLSRSNENLSGMKSSSATPGSGSKKQQQHQNVFLKHFSNGFSKAELEASFDPTPTSDSPRAQAVRNQAHFYQKLQQNEIADLLSLKENKSTNGLQQQQLGGQNSKFKPVINSSNSSTKQAKNQQHQQIAANISNQRRPASSTCKELQFSPLAPAATTNHSIQSFKSLITSKPQVSHNTVNEHVNNTQTMSRSTSMFSTNNVDATSAAASMKVKKHLSFGGPECWINFKFDYDSISQSLPSPIIEL